MYPDTMHAVFVKETTNLVQDVMESLILELFTIVVVFVEGTIVLVKGVTGFQIQGRSMTPAEYAMEPIVPVQDVMESQIQASFTTPAVFVQETTAHVVDVYVFHSPTRPTMHVGSVVAMRQATAPVDLRHQVHLLLLPHLRRLRHLPQLLNQDRTSA